MRSFKSENTTHMLFNALVMVVVMVKIQHKSDIQQDPFILIFQFMIEIEAKITLQSFAV